MSKNYDSQCTVIVCSYLGITLTLHPLQICREHAKDRLGPEVELTSTIVMTMNSNALQFEVSATKRGWEVVPEKNPEV